MNRIDRLMMKHMLAYRRGWPWSAMRGSTDCLKWSFRDLQNLDEALKFVKTKHTVVQAGGNLGLFPKRLAESFKRVITFEPDPELFLILAHNAPEKNIEAHQVALGNSSDPVAVSRWRRDNTGKPSHEGLTHICGPGTIPQMKLDDLKLETCNLIYLDIEGYEWNALRGSVETIERCRPVLAVEINKNAAFAGYAEQDFRDWIISLGYRFEKRVSSDDIFLPQESR